MVPPPFESAFAALDYAAPWRDLIHQLKFNQALQLVPSLADLMSQRLIQSIDIDSSILLLPVPSSAQRLRQRGFNPAWELTRHLGLKLGVSAFARALVRIQDAPAQSLLDVSQWAANVRGAFAVHPDWRGRINGQSVVLVDDVMTSMATLSELTRVVQQAGAAHVHVWVLARATLH